MTPPPDDDNATDNPWMSCLRRGDFSAAWEISDAALRARAGQTCWHLPRHLQSVWNGESIAGKRVLVRCYHGLGDTIQFIRYMPMLKATAAEVIVWAQPALLPLLRGAAGIDRLLPLHDGSPEADYDADVEIMELPHVFRTMLDDLPADVPYLSVGSGTLTDLKKDNSLAVGVVWQAGDWDERRSVPLDLLAPLAEIPGITLHALQRGAALAQWRDEYGPVSGSDRPEEAAATMRALDLVITVDSFPAHLAGALGRPVWTLLQHDADWRWMADRDDSPWYPTMRLFRQRRPGEWQPVLARVREALRQILPCSS